MRPKLFCRDLIGLDRLIRPNLRLSLNLLDQQEHLLHLSKSLTQLKSWRFVKKYLDVDATMKCSASVDHLQRQIWRNSFARKPYWCILIRTTHHMQLRHLSGSMLLWHVWVILKSEGNTIKLEALQLTRTILKLDHHNRDSKGNTRPDNSKKTSSNSSSLDRKCHVEEGSSPHKSSKTKKSIYLKSLTSLAPAFCC